MAVLSKYEDLAGPFLAQYPIGTNVTGAKLVKFVEDLPNGHIIKNDLNADNPLSAIKRHVSHGGRSGNLPEASRFIITTIDAKRQVYGIEALSKYAVSLASGSLLKSVSGAMRPYKTANSELAGVNADELSDEDRREHDGAVALVAKRRQPIADAYMLTIKTEWRDTMKALGVDAATADKLLTGLPQYQNFQKMLAATS